MAAASSRTGAIVAALVKSIVLSAVVVAVSVVVMQLSPVLGVLLMLAASGYGLVRSSRKDTPLTLFTALLPGGMALFCWLLQLGIAGTGDPTWPAAGIVLGVVIGWLSARGHRVYVKGRQVFAHRGAGAVTLWVLVFVVTQAVALLGLQQVAAVTLALGGFSTAIMVVQSLALAARSRGLRAPTVAGAIATLLLALLLDVTAWPDRHPIMPAHAQDMAQCGQYAAQAQGLAASLQGLQNARQASAQTKLQIDALARAIGRAQCVRTALWPQIKPALGTICNFSDNPWACWVSSMAGGPDASAPPGPPPVVTQPQPQPVTPPPLAAQPSRPTAPEPTGPGIGLRDALTALSHGMPSPPANVVAAGVVAAVVQLLAGLGAAVAQAAAAAASSTAPGSGHRTRILDGIDAINWLKNHGFPDAPDHFFDDKGQATSSFTAWLSLTHSSANPTRLLGFAGYLGDNDKPTGDFAITVLDDGAPPLQPVDPAPPVEPEAPPLEPEPPQPPETRQPPPVMPPVKGPTKIEEPTPPEKPKEDDKKKEPDKPDPCDALREALRRVEQELTRHRATLRGLQDDRDVLKRAYDNKWWASFLNFHVDMYNAVLTLNLTRLAPGNPAGHPAASIGQNLIAEALKYGINEYFEQNPKAKDIAKGGAKSGVVVAIGEFLKKRWNRCLRLAYNDAQFSATLTDRHIGTFAEFSGKQLERAQASSAAVQGIVGGFFAGQDIRKGGIEAGLLKARVQTVEMLLRKTQGFIDDAERRRTVAQQALDACLQQHGAGS